MKQVRYLVWKHAEALILLALAIVLVLFASASKADWYPGLAHAQSTFSDGANTPQTLKKLAALAGMKFLWQTDHLEQINKQKKDYRYDILTNDYGWVNYIRQFSVYSPLLCMAGTEIITRNGSHVLALTNVEQVFASIVFYSDCQEVLRQLNKLQSLAIAAHPNREKYLFDTTKAEGLNGIEFFNDSPGGYQKTLNWYLRLVKAGRKIFVTSGCDNHASTQGFSKITYVWWAETLNQENLILAFQNGQTYAATAGAYFEKINLVPKFTWQKIERPKFNITFRFKTIITSKKIVRIYCDGKLAEGSSLYLEAGNNKYLYSWVDNQVSKGKHSYVVTVEGCLVTSPIFLEVTKDKSTVIPKDNYDDWAPQVIESDNSVYDFIFGMGRRIAFLSNRDGKTVIYQADFDEARRLKKITPFYNIANFQEQVGFRSDGREVLLLGKQNRIYLLVFDSERNTKQLFDLKLQSNGAIFPSWTDGQNFYFAGANNKIYLAEVERDYADDGETVVNVIARTVPITEKLYFSTVSKDQKGFWQLCQIDTSGKVRKWLTSGNFDNINSTSGQLGAIAHLGIDDSVIYATKKHGNFDLAVLGENNTSQIVTSASANEIEPCWAYYCQEILFVTDRSGKKKIWWMTTEDLVAKPLNLK